MLGVSCKPKHHQGKEEELGRLLDEQPDVDVDEYRDRLGNTSLIMAAVRGHVHCVRRLIDAGADANTCNDSGHTTSDLRTYGQPQWLVHGPGQ